MKLCLEFSKQQYWDLCSCGKSIIDATAPVRAKFGQLIDKYANEAHKDLRRNQSAANNSNIWRTCHLVINLEAIKAQTPICGEFT